MAIIYHLIIQMYFYDYDCKYKSNAFDSFISIEQIFCNKYIRTILLKYMSFILQITGEYIHVKGRISPYWLQNSYTCDPFFGRRGFHL